MSPSTLNIVTLFFFSFRVYDTSMKTGGFSQLCIDTAWISLRGGKLLLKVHQAESHTKSAGLLLRGIVEAVETVMWGVGGGYLTDTLQQLWVAVIWEEGRLQTPEVEL